MWINITFLYITILKEKKPHSGGLSGEIVKSVGEWVNERMKREEEEEEDEENRTPMNKKKKKASERVTQY